MSEATMKYFTKVKTHHCVLLLVLVTRSSRQIHLKAVPVSSRIHHKIHSWNITSMLHWHFSEHGFSLCIYRIGAYEFFSWVFFPLQTQQNWLFLFSGLTLIFLVSVLFYYIVAEQINSKELFSDYEPRIIWQFL